MKVKDLVDTFKLNILSGEEGMDNEVTSCYTSDILSDVISSAKDSSVWITQQAHKNIVAVALLRRISAIIIVKDILPDEDVILMSNNEGIAVLGTSDDAFLMSGKLYRYLYE